MRKKCSTLEVGARWVAERRRSFSSAASAASAASGASAAGVKLDKDGPKAKSGAACGPPARAARRAEGVVAPQSQLAGAKVNKKAIKGFSETRGSLNPKP